MTTTFTARGSAEADKPMLEPQGDAPDLGNLPDAWGRLLFAAQAVKQPFGPTGSAEAGDCHRAVYLSLIARVFMALIESDLSARDLRCLSAILYEQRRSERESVQAGRGGRYAPTTGEGDPTPPGDRPFSDRLRRVVRQLYNVDLDAGSNHRAGAQVEDSHQDDGDQREEDTENRHD